MFSWSSNCLSPRKVLRGLKIDSSKWIMSQRILLHIRINISNTFNFFTRWKMPLGSILHWWKCSRNQMSCRNIFKWSRLIRFDWLQYMSRWLCMRLIRYNWCYNKEMSSRFLLPGRYFLIGHSNNLSNWKILSRAFHSAHALPSRKILRLNWIKYLQNLPHWHILSLWFVFRFNTRKWLHCWYYRYGSTSPMPTKDI